MCIDNSEAEVSKSLKFEINQTLFHDVKIIDIMSSASGSVIDNCNIEIIYSGGDTDKNIVLIFNNAKNVSIRNCRVKFRSKNQVNFTAVKNYGGVNTHLETPADSLEICGCRFDIQVEAENFPLCNKVCGVENILANSMSICNNYFSIKTNGNSKAQCAYGIVNSGRFARIENNNIKANAGHKSGTLKEAASAYGVYNEGLYMIFTGNNCVAEWGGKCVSLCNTAELCTIVSNKILSTHTICGRSVILTAPKNIVQGNIITNTSRNHHIIEIFADRNTVTNNYIQALIAAVSGCGIYVEGKPGAPITNCIISGNHINAVKDYGIALLNSKNNEVSGNIIHPAKNSVDFTPVFHCGRDNINYCPSMLLNKFNPLDYEQNIKSIDIGTE